LLVLTRKLDQSIVVSCEEVEVTFKIIRCGRDKVSVGIEAPPGVKILRAELQAERPAVSPPTPQAIGEADPVTRFVRRSAPATSVHRWP
jgi:carbon storage regulator CsrA